MVVSRAAAVPTILLVEDNPDDLELTVRELRRAHLDQRLFTFQDADESLRWLRANGGLDVSQALLLLDQSPHGTSGEQLLNILSTDATLNRLRVVVLTGSREIGIARFADCGHKPIAIIQKPLRLVELAHALEENPPTLKGNGPQSDKVSFSTENAAARRHLRRKA